MRWTIFLAVFGLATTGVMSFAEGPPGDQEAAGEARAPDDQRPDLIGSSPQYADYFNSTGVVRFQLIQGRLCLDPPRHRKGSQNREEHGVYESITVTAERGLPSIHYVYQSADRQITLSVEKALAMRIESWSPGTSERSILQQPAQGPIEWTYHRGEIEDTYTGWTLLHLREANPVAFDAHHGRLIARLLRGRSIKRLSLETRRRLLAAVQDSDSQPEVRIVSSGQIHDRVDKLKAPRRADRMLAHRTLLRWGTPVIPTLLQLNPADLEPEQERRVTEIIRRLRPRVDDTPASLAKLLINDRLYWSEVAPQLEQDKLQDANAYLALVGIEPIVAQSEPVHRIARGQ